VITIIPRIFNSILLQVGSNLCDKSSKQICLYYQAIGVAKCFGLNLAYLFIGLSQSRTDRKEIDMLWTIFVILLIMWLLGMVSSYTMGGFIHLLLIIALVVLVYNLLTGRRAAL
jgi:Family of unknown function (DUF5670)